MAKSYERSVASGSTDTFSVPFPKLDKAHVVVRVNGILIPSTDYTWPTDGSIQLTAGNPTAGSIVERRRVTPVDPIVTFSPGYIDHNDLNTADRQSLYLAQEANDKADDLEAVARVVLLGSDKESGVPNAIEVATVFPVVDGAVVMFRLMAATVPPDPVTVSFNGGAALPVFTNRGEPAIALDANMEVWGRYREADGEFWLVTDEDVSLLVADARDARDAAIQAAVDAVNATAAFMRSVTSFGAVAGGPASVNNVAIAAAVLWAQTYLGQLLWPDGEFETSVTIPGLHSVRHRGPGRIRRGSDVFWLEPRHTHTNTLYFSATGPADGDGLSVAEPLPHHAAFWAALSNYGPVLAGTWRGKLSAGSFSGTSNHTITVDGLRSQNPIYLSGPATGGYPNVPTAVMLGPNNGGGSYGIRFFGGMRVDFTDIKWKDFNGNFATAGVGHCTTVHHNCHVENCREGFIRSTGGDIQILGGIIDCNNIAGSNGYFGLFNGTHTIGGDTSNPTTTDPTVSGPLFKRCAQGAYAAENSTGHCNALFEDCATGVHAAASSRFNLDVSNFKRSTVVAARASGNSVILPVDCVFNTGTADANTRNIIVHSGGVDLAFQSAARAAMKEVQDVAGATHTGTTAATNVWSKLLFPAARKPHAASSSFLPIEVELEVWGTITGVAGTKALIWRLNNAATGTGGTQVGGVSLSAGVSGAFNFKTTVILNGNSQLWRSLMTVHNTAPLVQVNTAARAMDDGADNYFNLVATLGSAADSIAISQITIRVL